MSLLETKYEPLVASTRARLGTDPFLQRLASPSINRTMLLRFLAEYSALGVQMTEPVDGWIRRAGERTIAIGEASIGNELVKHAHHEEGHHLMLIDDTRALVRRWNSEQPQKPLDAAKLLAQTALPAMRDYIDLHEEVIKSDKPFAQVAIELEIEGLALSWAPAFVENVKRVLGAEASAELSFLHEHIQLDIGHTAFNKRLMNNLLAARPADIEHLAAIGRRALSAYLDFLMQTWTKVEKTLGQTAHSGASPVL